MSCASCGSKTPKFRHPKTNLLYCNNECFIGSKRPRDDNFQIKGSDGGILNHDASVRLMNESELIRSLIEDTNDQIIELPIKTNTLLHMLEILRNFDEAMDIYSLQDKIELALALNYLSFTQRIWMMLMRNIFSPFFNGFYNVNFARTYYDLPSDGGFTKTITNEYDIPIGILKRYPRYSSGIQTKRPSIINFSNDQIIEMFVSFDLFYPAVLDLIRKTHVRFFTIVSEIMQNRKMKLNDQTMAQFDNSVYLEYEKELPGFRNLARLFDEESIMLQERNDQMYIIRQLIKKCILNKNYSLLYKITTPEKFKEIVNDDSNMQKILNTDRKFLFLEIKKY